MSVISPNYLTPIVRLNTYKLLYEFRFAQRRRKYRCAAQVLSQHEPAENKNCRSGRSYSAVDTWFKTVIFCFCSFSLAHVNAGQSREEWEETGGGVRATEVGRMEFDKALLWDRSLQAASEESYIVHERTPKCYTTLSEEHQTYLHISIDVELKRCLTKIR